MNIERILNILGVAGVTASLIFVGLELRQSQRIALVSQIQERSYAVSAETNAFTEADLDWLSSKFRIAPKSILTTEQKAARNSNNQSWFFMKPITFNILKA